MAAISSDFLAITERNKMQTAQLITGGLQLMLLASIALLLMLDVQHLAIALSKFNMIFVGISLFYLSIKLVRVISTPSVWILLLSLITANILSYGHDEILFINVTVSLVYALLHLQKNKKEALQLLTLIAIPLTFSALHIAARGCLCLNEDILSAWSGTFVVLGIWLLVKFHLTLLNTYAEKIIIVLLFLYVFILVQLPEKDSHLADPFHIFNFSLHYEYFVSTFYIAIYAAFALIIAVYLIFKTSRLLRIALIIISLLLANFILTSSWRPIWLGLIIGSTFMLMLVEKHERLILIGAMVMMQIVLFSTNVANYGDRLIELSQKIQSEERTVIWREAWQMQSTSSSQQWIYGYGLNSFVGDFQQFSSYHREMNVNFRSPHNVVLDVLHSSGILGVLLLMLIIYYLYSELIHISRNHKNSKNKQALACAMLAVLSVSLIANGLNHGFFTRISIYPVVYVFGMLIYLQHNHHQQNHLS